MDTAPETAAALPPPAPLEPWWGPLELPPGELRRWRIGPRTLWLERRSHELRVVHAFGDDPLDGSLERGAPADEGEIPEGAAQLRFALREGAPAPTLRAALAERDAVVRPESPLLVPTGEEVTIYVSAPLWLALELPAAGGRAARPLVELPTWRLSDTWFGPSTLVGELAYALSTTGQLELAEVHARAHRAITPIRVRNSAPEPLSIVRLKVPLPYLALYRAGGTLWTTAVTLEHEEEGDSAALQLTRGAPREAQADGAQPERIAEARRTGGSNMVLRAFSRIFRSD